MSNIITISDESFESTLQQETVPVLVDFWAEWCGPCKMIAPILEELAVEFDGKVQIAKLNIDDNPKSPQQFSVRGIPTVILFKDGQPVATKVGALNKTQMTDFLNESL